MNVKTRWGLCLALVVSVACGCGTSGSQTNCTDGDRRCSGSDTVEVCSKGQWTRLADCPAGQECQSGECVDACVPDCAGRECGDDGCGGSCGNCTSPKVCNADGQCVDACVPDCAGRDCGGNGCGGSCGACSLGEVCNETAGACLTDCTPDCSGIDCGLDPVCSSLCDSCPAGQECDLPNETCVAICVGDCSGKSCGDDGCGGSCGNCTSPKVCNADGQCVDSAPVCPDSSCDAGEDCHNCPEDCGECLQCDATTAAEMMDCVSRERFLAGIQTVAGPRSPGSSGWLAAQNYCATTLEDLGFSIELQNYGSGLNVIGTMSGTDLSNEIVVILAHYDHIGTCEGADDNASGISAILEMARILSLYDFSRSLVVMCTDEEEVDRIGSFEFARRANNARDEIVVAFNIDSISFAVDEPNSQQLPAGFAQRYPELAGELAANQNRATFIYVGHDPYSRDAAMALKTYGNSIGLWTGRAEISIDDLFLPENMRSDSVSFWTYAYPSILVNDTSELRNACYHCAGCDDTVDTLDIDFGVKVVKATLAAVADTLGGLNALFDRPPVVACSSICGSITTGDQVSCLIDVLSGFLDPYDYPLCNAGITTVAECNACIDSLPLIEGDCSLIAFSCGL